MYGPLLFIHSWMRWLVLGVLLFLIFKTLFVQINKSKWQPKDDATLWVFDQIFGYQILFGLVLWAGTSPLTKMVFKNFSVIQEDPVLFFWFLRHPLTMIVAMGFFQGGYDKFKEAVPEKKNKILLFTLIITLVIILSAIPWSNLIFGRPLFRLEMI